MSKQPSENQKSGRKFTESYFRSDSATATSNEDNSLERRLFTLIGNELRRTTAENEFATLENRIIRILRNEFVNDIMMEINTSDDEIATFFNRFIRSVPGLSEICDRRGNEQLRGDDTVQTKKDKVERPIKAEGRNQAKKEGKITCGSLDEDNIRTVLELFRAPILVTCRACEDMRRIIRSGRRMIREIQVIAAMRGDFNSLRRVEMKCIDELDNGGSLRYRRQVSSIGNWRQLFRRRCRNVHPSSCRERGCYYVVFDKPDRPRIVPQISAKRSVVIKIKKKCTIFMKKSTKQSTKRWNECSAKAEISRVIQALRYVCFSACMNNRNISGVSNTERTLLPDFADSHSVNNGDSENADSINTNGTREAESSRSSTIVSESTDPTPAMCPSSMECDDLYRLPTSGSTQNSTGPEERPTGISLTTLIDTSDRPSPAGDASRVFSVMLRTGPVQVQDVTVVLHSDRVLVASVAQRSRAVAGGWSGSLQRRWVLPEHVDVNNIQCYLGGGTLLITEFPVSDFHWVFGSEFVALGPPSRNASPYLYPYHRRP